MGIAIDADNVYVSDARNNAIRSINRTTRVVTTIAGMPVIPGGVDGFGEKARFNHPVGMWGDGTNLYVVDSGNRSIRKIEIATSLVTTIAHLPPVIQYPDLQGIW